MNESDMEQLNAATLSLRVAADKWRNTFDELRDRRHKLIIFQSRLSGVMLGRGSGDVEQLSVDVEVGEALLRKAREAHLANETAYSNAFRKYLQARRESGFALPTI